MNKFLNDKDSARVGKTVMVFAVFVTVFVGFKCIQELQFFGNSSNDISNVSTIDVTGTGDAVALPDIAQENFTVEQKGASIAEAQALVSKKVNDAMAFLNTSGVDAKDIKTENYSANPEYNYPTPCYSGNCPLTTSAPKILDYVVSESITVKIRDTGAVGKIVDGLGAEGVTGLNGPNFMVENPDKVNAEARDLAIADAKSKAEALAKSLGVSLVRIVRYSDNNGGYATPMYSKAMAMDAVGAAPVSNVPSGQNKYTSNVTITYQIR